MIKTVLLICLTFLPSLGYSQATAQEPQTPVTKIVRVRYGNAEAIKNLIRNGTGATITADNGMKAIVIKGKTADVESIQQAIRELDTPATASTSKDVEILVYVVGASNKPEAPVTEQNAAAIAPVLKQLRSIFPYKNYELLSTMLLRSSEGTGARNTGVMKDFTGTPGYTFPNVYSIHYDSARVSAEGSRPFVHLENFGFELSLSFQIGPRQPGDPEKFATTQIQPHQIGIRSDVDLQEGQKIVVGKSNIESSDSALFVVLAAKLVD